jgi:hypothetical protein
MPVQPILERVGGTRNVSSIIGTFHDRLLETPERIHGLERVDVRTRYHLDGEHDERS